MHVELVLPPQIPKLYASNNVKILIKFMYIRSEAKNHGNISFEKKLRMGLNT
jgi:hypothetical protein